MTSCLLTWITQSSQNEVYHYRKEFAPMGATFLYEMTPIYMQGNKENDGVASPEGVPIHLKFFQFSFVKLLSSA